MTTSVFSTSAADFAADFALPQNADIVRYLNSAQPQAHSDVASELEIVSRDFASVRRLFTPFAYAYVVLLTPKGTFCAGAIGMSGLLFRLPPEIHAEALAEKGKAMEMIGSNWFSFNPFRVDLTTAENRSAMQKWCAAAWKYGS